MNTSKSAEWLEVIAAEPMLAALLFEVEATADRGGLWFCRVIVWQREFKPRLMRLVGWGRVEDPEWLQTPAAYQTAYRAVFEALPPCRADGCP